MAFIFDFGFLLLLIFFDIRGHVSRETFRTEPVPTYRLSDVGEGGTEHPDRSRYRHSTMAGSPDLRLTIETERKVPFDQKIVLVGIYPSERMRTQPKRQILSKEKKTKNRPRENENRPK